VAAADKAAREFSEAMDGNVRGMLEWLHFPSQSRPKTMGAGQAVYAKGDPVHVWCVSQGRWMKDGVVQEVAAEDMVINGAAVPAGSVKVAFGHSSHNAPQGSIGWDVLHGRSKRTTHAAGVKWVMPTHLREVVRRDKSARRTSPSPNGRRLSRPRPAPKDGSPLASILSHEMQAELKAVEQRCLRAGRLYIDTDFACPTSSFLNFGGKNAVTAWCRPQEITLHDGRPLTNEDYWTLFGAPPQADWQLFRDKPRCADVLQGELGDCWFLSSLAALAEFQGGRFVRALLPGQSGVSPAGVYCVRLCLGGRWRGVLVDDRLPCIGGGRYYTQLACCVTHRLQLWASLIEKAFAKVCGSYEALVGGEAGEALSVLTGWPCTMIRFNRADFDPEIFWATLASSRDAGFLMTCSTCDIKSSCLEPFHVSSLMDVYEVSHGKGRARLLKIRNQQEKEKTKWQGAWSDTCPNWTPQLRRQLGCPEGGTPGVYFMALGDFLQQFAHCTICRVRSGEWHEAREPVHLPSNDVPCVGLVLKASETTECCLSLVQPEERIRKGPLYKSLSSEPEACIGFVVMNSSSSKAGAGGKAAAHTPSAHMRCRAAVNADCWLQPNRSYTVVPLCLHPGAPLAATWACVSSRKVAFEECHLDRDTVRAAWAAYARSNCESSENFHGAVLHLGKAEGGAVVALAENTTPGYFSVELSFHSEGLHYSRRKAVTSDWLPPGHGQILQVAQPNTGSGGSAGWRSQHKFQMTSKGPGKLVHNPPVGAEGSGDLHTPFRLA